MINVSLFVNNYNFTPVFLKQAYHADKKRAGSSSYISMHLFLKISLFKMYHFEHTSHDNNLDFYH